MSGICGWIGHGGAEGDRAALLASMAAPLAEYDGSRIGTWVGEDAGLAAARPDAARSLLTENHLTAAVAGHPDWEDPELTDLSRRAGPAAAMVAAYRRWGADCFAQTRGAFAAALRDGDVALVATDRVGICPILYQQAGRCLVFGSTSVAMDPHPRAAAEIDPQGIFSYVWHGCVPAPETVRKGRARLLPGHYLRFAKGRLETVRYVRTEYRDHDATPLPELQEELHRLLRDAVRRDAEGARVGAFLSGGVDSSTVAGILSEVGGAPARTYSIGFDAQAYDELRYARIVAKRFGTDHHEYYVTPADVEAAVPRIARIYSEPFGNESAVPTYYCARMAREDGVERLLGGDGGDELFGGNERYAIQKLFELYQIVPAPLRKYLLEPVLFHFPFGSRIWPVRKGRGYVRHANTPLPARMRSHAETERQGIAAMFEPEFLRQVDPSRPRALAAQVYNGACSSHFLNRILELDAKFTLADVDLPKVSRMCEMAGLRVSYPLLHNTIVDFAARLDVGLKVKGFKLRWFFKWAMRDFLPRQTLTKKKQGFGLPFGVWLQTHRPLQVLAEDSLANLKQRRILRPAVVDDMLEAHRTVHAHYYGGEIWQLMMLEQWFQAHVDDRSSVVAPRG
ncbi:MAG: asparagine synthetase B family protein [Planctomycetota bacterium]|jgi:asparagine synthase (glutamine-hydrolysing)